MLKIYISKVVEPPKPPKTPEQLRIRSWNRKLVASVLVILFFLAAHIGIDILGRQYLEYELAVCEFENRTLTTNYEYFLADAKNELEHCEIVIAETERMLEEIEL